MPYRNMSLDELARLIGMDAREVKRLAERGRLPGQMIAGQWRFNRDQLLDWLQREMHSLDWEHIRNLERATADVHDQSIISSLLPNDGIDMNLPARSKASVLRELVGLGERTGLIYDPEALVEALEEREGLGSTALPGGFAFPHPRRPLPYATAEPLLCLARVAAGIPFGAPDGQLTFIFVLICNHEGRQHLHVLARLAQIFNTGLAATLRDIDDPTEALTAILKAEGAVLAKRK